MLINDGTGSGNAVKVTSDSRLAADAVTRSAAAEAARTGKAYVISTKGTIAPTSTGGIMAFIQNDSQAESIVIDEVMVGCDNTKLIIREYVGMTVGSFSDNTAVKAANTNSRFPIHPDVTAYYWDGTNHGIGGLTAGTILSSAYVSTGTITLSHGGDIIIAPGANFAIHLDNNSGGTLNAAVNIRYHVEVI